MASALPPGIGSISSQQLTTDQRREIVALCQAVFAEDFSIFFESLGDATHLLVRADRALVAYACWVVRWFHPEGLPPLRTAYVKAVAVAPECQRRGWGTLMMRRLCEQVAAEYDLLALTTVIPAYYARLGWVQWRGPTAIRTISGRLPGVGRRPMILRTANTPPLDLDAPLTAAWRADALW